jgi:CO/xanthine dehydrogenase Mo-binding subunit
MGAIGKSIKRVDALGKVTGNALFPGDINKPNQTYAKILFSNVPHARIIKIDASEAEAMPGVVAVLTAADVPVNEYGLNNMDQPVLCGPGAVKPYTDRVRFIGDQIAVIVAESEAIATRARDLIKIDYEMLPVVTDPLDAMKPDAILLHPDKGSNTFGHYLIRKGDVSNAFKQADVIIEAEYRTPAQEHVFLQPEAGIAYIDEEGRVTVEASGQWVHEDQHQIAHALNLPLEQVRVIYPAIGGAFGGREDISIQIALALAAMRLHERGIERPVKIIWSREESIIGHHKRHPYIIRSKWGATREGKVIAAENELIADGGAYYYTSTKVLGNATLMCTGPYEIPNVHVDSYAVYTNNIPNGAFRGFGGPQGAFAAEMQMDKLAEALRMDPVEIRMKNILHTGSLLSVGTPIPGQVNLEEVLRQCALKAGWHETPSGWQLKASMKNQGDDGSKRRGIGIGVAFKNIGFSFGYQENCTAEIELHGDAEIDQVILKHAGEEVGQGAHTVFIQMAAEALDVPIDKISLIASDTAVTGTSVSVSASRMTFMAGNAIRGAAALALEKWQNEERPTVATYTYLAPKTTPYDPHTGRSEPNVAYGYVAEAAEVLVDVETGELKITKVICADDVGKAISPNLVKGQIEGAVVQALGYTTIENFIQKDGYTLTKNLSTYVIPTVLDVPDEVESIILEFPEERGPWGARGMAEMPVLPLAPAICAAVKQATGVWFDEFPLTPERILTGIGEFEN